MSKNKISIVTGTLNRYHLLPALFSNTVYANENLELVLVDGGSKDGTIGLIKTEKHPRIKLIEYGKRSSYPHFMNLGIKNASHELICQWNDDSLLVNDWQEVFSEIDEHDGYLFNWQNNTLKASQNSMGPWHLLNNADKGGEIVMNYGIYKKDVFRKYGLYNPKYKYYCADGEMALRAYCGGAKFKNLPHIKVCVLPVEKTAIHDSNLASIYYEDVKKYHNGNIDRVEKLI
jgi:glycosyltransferase involved in cell wall biosynthesis